MDTERVEEDAMPELSQRPNVKQNSRQDKLEGPNEFKICVKFITQWNTCYGKKGRVGKRVRDTMGEDKCWRS